MLGRVGVLVSSALLAVSCDGGDADRSADATAVTVETSPTATLSSRAAGRLVVDRTYVSRPQFEEGSRLFVELRDPGGELMLARTIDDQDAASVRIVDDDVPHGMYELTVTQRPCAGTCEFLDPAFAECVVVIEVGPASRYELSIASIGRPCRLT